MRFLLVLLEADRSKQELSEEHCQYLSYQMLRPALDLDALDEGSFWIDGGVDMNPIG